MRNVRGARIGMIFQEPSAALNPVFTIGAQLCAALRAHRTSPNARPARAPKPCCARSASRSRAPPPPHPHRVVGRHVPTRHDRHGAGRRRAVADRRRADDRAGCHDPGRNRRVDRRSSRADAGIAVLFISHDLGLVARLCHRIAVAYAGQIVEVGAANACCARPAIPTRRGWCAACRTARHRRAAAGHPRRTAVVRRLAHRLPLRAALSLGRRGLRGCTGIAEPAARRRGALLAQRRAVAAMERA